MAEAVAQKKWWVRNRTPVAAPVEEREAAPDNEPALDTLSKAELAALAESKGLDPAGTKAELVERLTDA